MGQGKDMKMSKISIVYQKLVFYFCPYLKEQEIEIITVLSKLAITSPRALISTDCDQDWELVCK